MFEKKVDNQPGPSPISVRSTVFDDALSIVEQVSDQPMADYSFFASKKFKLCFLAMCLNTILFALDQFIITVAVPQIVNRFNALDKIQWLNTAFFIPCAAFILIFTQFMTVVSPRWMYFGAIVIFEIGSVVCGAATSMDMLIVGRGLCGLGGAGIWNGAFSIQGELIPPHKRPSYFGLTGVSYILALVMGPLVGGALTDSGANGWRWCFYINLPIDGLALAMLLLTLPDVPLLRPFDETPKRRSTLMKLLTLDWIGVILCLAFVTCLGMGLQWGGISRSWQDGAVVLTLVIAAASFIALVGWSLYMGPRAMIPMSLLKKRHFSATLWVSFLGYGAVVVMLYYIPLFFEAIKEKSATRAGVLLLGLQMTMCPLLIITGKLGERIGQAKLFILIGSCFISVASGLFTLLKPSSSIAMVVSFEVVAGIGFGLVLTIMMVLMQAEFYSQPALIPHATGLFNFWGFIGRIIGMSVATSIFENKLHDHLVEIPGMSAELVARVSASPDAVWHAVPEKLRGAVLDTYSKSLNYVWWISLAFGVGTLVAGGAAKNLNLRTLGEAAASSAASLSGGSATSLRLDSADRDGDEMKDTV